MRISSNTFYTSTLSGMLDQQSAISKLSQQIASGKKLTSAADDPVAAGKVMSLNNQIALSTQYQANMTTLANTQQEETTVLNQMQSSLQSVQGALSASNGNNDATSNTSTAATLSSLAQQILDMANYRDSNGNYIFAGTSSTTKPYAYDATATPPQTTFAGNTNTRQVQIGQGITVQANDSLETVMQSGGGSGDLLASLYDVVNKLQSNTATQADITAAYSVVTNSLNSLQTIQVSLAARQNQVSNQQDTIKQLLNTSQNAIDNLSQVDQASAIVELQQRQVTLQAAQNAFSQTSKLSLFNYL